WDLYAVVRRVAAMVGMGTIDELLKPPDNNQPPDPKVIKAMTDAQLKMRELAQDEKDSQRKLQLETLSERMKFMTEAMQIQNNREQRASQERIEAANLAEERMKMAQGALVHPLSTPVAQQFAGTWPDAP